MTSHFVLIHFSFAIQSQDGDPENDRKVSRSRKGIAGEPERSARRTGEQEASLDVITPPSASKSGGGYTYHFFPAYEYT